MNRIKELRELYKITQQELADACGTNPQNIQRYENGKRELNTSRLREIAEGFTDLGHPTKASELLSTEDQAINYDQELSAKIKGLEENLKTQHDEYLNFLIQKQQGKE